ncbi:hypothetical protein BD410DRAFT_899812 [Rickenella mellea]|uniref:F-box domain-containing protein n=1 Tax=Rickenella mellea TaxID=50990 RepID=A0A4Y7PY62_9AGAM|nr:hypothetical protein BD410DRAFT_899812 [Rickenella mellea]
MNFNVLPPEVISTILYSVGARSIYVVELDMTGNVDGPREYTTIAEKLSHLKRFDRSWRRLEWNTRENWTIPGGTLLWELYGGILITGQSDEEGYWKIDIRELPSSRKEPPVRAWVLDRIALPLVDLATHTKHDLLVLVSKQDGQSVIDLHIRTLSRNEQHPSATLGILRHDMMKTNNSHGFLVHIAGSLLGMLASDIDDLGQVINQLVIWDWITGNRLAYMCGLRGFIDFAFLSQRYFLLSSLDIDNTTEHVPSPSLDVYDLQTSAGHSSTEHSYYVRRYLLPNVKASAMASLIRIYAESSADSEPCVYNVEDGNAGEDWFKFSSFSVSPTSTLYAIQIFLKPKEPPMGGDLQELILFAPQSTFLPSSASPRSDISPLSLDFELLPKIRPETCHTRAKTVAWDKWGPHGTRLMRHSDFFNLEHSYYPFGSRIVLPSPIPPRTDPTGLIVEEYEECRIRVLALGALPNIA